MITGYFSEKKKEEEKSGHIFNRSPKVLVFLLFMQISLYPCRFTSSINVIYFFFKTRITTNDLYVLLCNYLYLARYLFEIFTTNSKYQPKTFNIKNVSIIYD